MEYTHVGRYQLVKRASARGLGVLYEAFDPVMKRRVAIKFAPRLAVSGDADGRAQQDILFDARQLAQFDHPNIIKILAWEEQDGAPYLVMEKFDAPPLSTILASGAAPADKVVIWIGAAAKGLDQAHSRGLIHRNLTAESILADSEGLVKITGFEAARPAQFLNSADAEQDPSLLLDSIIYMSPELVRGDPLEPRSDQYSLALIAFQALSGELPFVSESPIEILFKIVFQQAPVRAALGDRYRAAIPVLERALSKSSSDRYDSCTDFGNALRGALLAVAAQTRVAPRVDIDRLRDSEPASLAPGESTLLAAPRFGVEVLRRSALSNPVYWIAGAALTMIVVMTVLFLTRAKPLGPPSEVSRPAAPPGTTPAPIVPSHAAQEIKKSHIPTVSNQTAAKRKRIDGPVKKNELKPDVDYKMKDKKATH